MNLAYSVTKHKFVSFLIGTIVVQAVALSAAFYLRSLSVSSALPAAAAKEVLGADIPSSSAAAPVAAAAPDEVVLPTTTVRHVVKRGDTLSSIWSEHGAARSGGVAAAKALKDLEPKAAVLKEGTALELSISASGDIVGLRHQFADTKAAELKGDSTNGYTGSIEEIPVEEAARTISGMITESFALAARDQNVPYEVVDDLVDLFSGRVAFERSIQPGDTFTVTYVERRLADGTVLAPGPIQTASLGTGARILAAIRHTGSDGKAHYYNETGAVLGNSFLRYPLKFSRISSVFSQGRFHPVLKIKRPHNGVDFAAPTGTAVRSVADGVVVFAGWNEGGGRTIKIKHCDRYSTAYLHLSKIDKQIKKGAPVSRGQLIGAVGMSGLASGPHLHYSLYDRGRYVNPLRAELPTVSKVPPLPPSYLTAALSTLEQFHSQVRLAHADVPKRRA